MQLPKITISSNSKITERRLLPMTGEVLVQRGQTVQAVQVIARGEIPHRYQVINVARQLALPGDDIGEVMLKAEGDAVEADETIAMVKSRFPFLQRAARTPIAGHIAKIGQGWVLVEVERTVVEVQAFVNGVVTGLIPNRGVVIEAQGAVIEAACGFGGEAYGRLNRLVASPFNALEASDLEDADEVEQDIIVAGRSADEALIRQAEEKKVRGIIVGSIDASLLNLDPPTKVCVVATEGFGDIPISPYTFGHLTALNGREVSIRGQTPAIMTATREADGALPIILATSQRGSAANNAETTKFGNVQIGSRVRVTRGRLLGAVGEVNALPPEPQATEVGLMTTGAYVTIDGASHYIPWMNLVLLN